MEKSKMSRRPRESNWGDVEDYHHLNTPTPPQLQPSRHVRLHVELLAKDPPSYLVRHHNGNQWLVMMAADGTLEVAEAACETKIDITHYVLNAVQLFQEAG